MKFVETYLTDKKAEREGTWVPIGDGAQVKVARIGTPEYRNRLRQLGKPYERQIRKGNLSPEINEQVTVQALAEVILLDWTGIEGEGLERFGVTVAADNSVPYSVENAKILLIEFPDFRDEVVDLASNVETFRAENVEDALGKSESS